MGLGHCALKKFLRGNFRSLAIVLMGNSGAGEAERLHILSFARPLVVPFRPRGGGLVEDGADAFVERQGLLVALAGTLVVGSGQGDFTEAVDQLAVTFSWESRLCAMLSAFSSRAVLPSPVKGINSANRRLRA
jgi:hypothetical protein